jgi:parvulin-like peptidyl-prolyl isomerase
VLGGDEPAGEEAEEIDISEERVGEFLATREEEARTLYAQRAAIYDVPERVRARHILLQLPSDADEATVAAAEARAEEIRARLEAGEDFAALAKEYSDDPGSKDAGGDLGFFGRGQMVKPFEDAAFALEPGVVSEPVRSDFGIHIIRVEEHTQARNTPFEEVRTDLARELLEREVRMEQAREQAQKISAEVAGGESVEDAARAEGLTLERSGWLRRRPDGFVPGLGAAPEVLATAFALDPGQSSSRIFEVDGKLALVQVLGRQLPDDVDIDKGIADVQQELENQKRNLLAQSWVNSKRTELAEKGEVAVDLSRVSGGGG